MNTEDLYFKLKTKSVIAEELLEYLKTFTNYERHIYDQTDVPIELISKDRVLSYFHQLNFSIKGMKMNPFEKYDWYAVPTYWGYSVNLALNSINYQALFRDSQDFSVEELNYELNTYYLVNTSIEHCVQNYEEDRYILVILPPSDIFEEDKDYFYYRNLIQLENL
jgi:hypothetical protein